MSPRAKICAAVLLLGVLITPPAAAQPAGEQPNVAENPWWRGYEVRSMVRTPDGRRIHVFCTGSGGPAVVLESGLGDGAWSWRTVQPAIAKTTRVCSYDRSGFGLSDEAHGPRDVDAMAADLAVVVRAAGHGRPVVLVSHSLGGGIIRQYAYRHADMVAGMVLVDPSSDHQAERFAVINEGLVKPPASGDPTRRCMELLEKGPIPEGTADYKACIPSPPADMPADLRHFHYEYNQSPVHLREVLAERDAAFGGADDRAADAARHSLGDLPMIILTAGAQGPAGGAFTADDMAKVSLVVYQLHNEMARLSSKARRRVVAGSHHYIQYDKPEAVIDAVADMLAEVRTQKRRS